MSKDIPNLYLLRAADIAARAQTFSHPWNVRSELTGYQLGKSTGLRNTMETGVKEGMCLMDNVVFGLRQERKVSMEVAVANITNRVLKAKLT